MDRRFRFDRSWVAAGLAAASAFGWGCGGGDIDRQIAVQPGGELSIDIELGSGISFDHGSLQIASDAIDEIRIATDTSGWGGYAVDVDIRDSNGQVHVVGRVDGALHWMFGGPTVEFRVVVPHGFRVKAHIVGGDLLLEDLIGPVSARVGENEITLRRFEGEARLVSDGGPVRAEDVDGTLRIDSGGGEVAVTGIHGHIELDSGNGQSEIASVTGRVAVATNHGAIRASRIRGDIRVRSVRGRIEIEDVEGEVDAETDRSRIEVAGLDGPIRARSERGGIDVEFVCPPAGTIETTRGSIRIEAPGLFGFDLDAETERGKIEIDRHFAFEPPAAGTEVAAAPIRAEQFRELEQLGQQVADEVQARATDQWQDVQREWKEWRQTGDLAWDPGPSVDRRSKPWPWDHDSWNWKERDLGQTYRDWARNVADQHGEKFSRMRKKRGAQMLGRVNGGGELLRLRTERGSIRIDH
ncbi:MAG: DUF4097 family beta strand repeat-containing protein [Myxococcota bacterium]